MSETNKTYRNAGLYSFGDGFNILNSAPIDSRTYVSNITDIYDDANWAGIGVKPYPGLIVSAPSGDVKIYVGPTISKITDITDSTEQIGWRNKANWLDVNIPKIEPEDAGRLLTIVETTNDDQTTSYSAQWVEAPSGLPTMGQSEAGKLLTVVETSTGSGVYVAQWVDAPSGLPTINPETDANKILQVNSNGTGVTWVENTHPEELPTITEDENGKVLTVVKTSEPDGTTTYSAQWDNVPKQIPPYTIDDRGKVLTVSSDETDTEVLEWSTVDTSFMKSVTTDALFEFVTRGGLTPGMKYRITDYYPAVSPDYSIRINNSVYNIGVGSTDNVKFDVIVTASSESTLFDDVELVAKVAGPGATFDYTKYEAKYDLVGNRNGVNYSYLQPSAAGVIYYMKDQFGNEASYDFENIFYVDPSVHGMTWHTFTGGKSGDLRQYGIIQNVRIKHSIETLPGIIFDFSAHHANNTGRIIDVEINNCSGIYTTCASLRHVKIINSNAVSITISYNDTAMIYPLFENLNICNNENLTINCASEFIGRFTECGLHINNINILPSFTPKTIDVADLYNQTTGIVIRGLEDSNYASNLRLTPETGSWIIALLEENPNACVLLFGNSEYVRSIISDVRFDILVYDSIFNAPKNIKPYDIFNPNDDGGYIRAYSLEIPQFQSTATSVVELGI